MNAILFLSLLTVVSFATVVIVLLALKNIEYDYNSIRSGDIPAAEVKQIQLRLWNFIRAEVDTDSSDSLDEDELRKWIEMEQKSLKERQLQLHFDSFVKEMRGRMEVISKEVLFGKELRATATNEKRFSEADRNWDGFLTVNEFESFLYPSRDVLAQEFIDWLTPGRGDMGQVSLEGPTGELIRSLNLRNASLDINHDQVLDLDEITGWLLPSQADYRDNEADHLFSMYDSDGDNELSWEEIRSGYISFLPFLPQSVWTNPSLLVDAKSAESTFSKDSGAGKDNSSRQPQFFESMPSTLNHESEHCCDRRLPFIIPPPQVCDSPHVQTR